MMDATTYRRNSMEANVAVAVLLWGLLSFVLGYYKIFTLFPRPIFGVTVIIIQAALVAIYLLNGNVKEFCDNIPLKAISLFHVWRIIAGWIFLSFSGTLSPVFINNAAYGDIISGFLGLSVFILGHKKFNYYVFNIVGLLDFFIAVGTGITITLTGDPMMAPLVELPLIMIPLFGVPLSGITHFISLSRLLKMKTYKLTDVINS